MERQRDDMSAQAARRASIDAAISSFRERMEDVLTIVGESACDMKSTAITLFELSEQASRRAEGAVEAIGGITKLMQEISAYTSTVAASVAQQNAAIGEISHNAAGAAHETSKVVAVLGEVAGAATATRASAETALTASTSVENAVGNLRAEVESFLAKVAV